MSYEVIQEKALELAKLLNISQFKASNGWCQRFCRRADLSCHTREGERASANEEAANFAKEWMPALLSELKVGPKDVFNADETGMIFNAHPNKTLAPHRIAGMKRNMNRVTLLLCCNADGTERLKPVIVGRAIRPTCFGPKDAPSSFQPHAFVHYFSNAAAWMTAMVSDKKRSNVDE